MLSKDERDLLSDVHASQLRIEERCVSCQNVQAQHHSTIYGNGRMGIKLKTEILWWFWGGCAAFLLFGGGGIWLLQILRSGV